MNFLCHGRDVLHDPHLLVGTQLPDWVSVLDRRARPSREIVAKLGASSDEVGLIARGVSRHWHDDVWFHTTPAFLTLTEAMTAELRAAHPEDRRFRAHFIAHVLLEMLLDAYLMESQPGLLERFYTQLARVSDAALVRGATSLWQRSFPDLVRLRARVVASQFPRGYLVDDELGARLSGVLARVRQPALPPALVALFPQFRRLVYSHAEALLTPPAHPGA